MKSIIEAPPIIVFIRLACPGQSTKVNWIYSNPFTFSLCFSINQEGIFTTNAENPKSSVMPLSLLWGFLSKPAVDAIVLSALHKEVLPLSMCPNTPILMLMMFEG